MADSTSAVPKEPVSAPAFLRVFDAFRRRPKRSGTRRLIRMERRAARRRPPGGQDQEQRGDWAEPPPVLDLSLDHQDDRDDLLGMLTARCGNQPVWRLPEGAEGEPPRVGDQAPPEPRATTQELYALLGRLVGRSEASRNGFLWKKRAPAPPRFRRLRSLLWLGECDLRSIRDNVLNEEVGQADKPLADSRRAQIHVIADLRRVKQKHIGAQAAPLWASGETAAGEDESSNEGWKQRRRRRFWLLDNYIRASHWLATQIARVSSRITFGKLDAILLTPLAFGVNVVAFMAPLVLGTFSVAGTFGSAAQGVNNVVTAVAAVVLLFVYLSLAPFLVLPWNAYRWLNEHRYDDEDQSFPHHRARGIRVLNLIQLQRDLTGWFPVEPHTREAPGPRPPVSRARPSTRRGLARLFFGGRPPERPTPDQAVRGDPEHTDGLVERIPYIHRLAVNAFLDDLAHTHSGTAHRPWFPLQRGRDQRPVLILDQDRADRVGAYLVRLIEDERLRRGYPDPLLIVQVRSADSTPLVDGGVHAERYLDLPEAQGRTGEEKGEAEAQGRSGEEREVARWLRARHASGQLGRERTVTLRVPQLPHTLDWNADRPETMTVWPVSTLAVSSAAVVVVLIAGVTVPLTSVVPSYVQSKNPCVVEGVQSPPGISRTEDDDCVGVTFGAFPFHDRLETLVDAIHEQNQEVEEGDRPYVTVVFFAELNTLGTSDLSLSGVQGELLGLAEGQEVHNNRNSDSLPRIKLMLANAGDGWSHARTVAQQVVDLSKNEDLGMDRPIAVIGLGHSVQSNTEAIAELSAGELPMVGTTATFDDVAYLDTGVPSPYFFPMAPANSRLARQAAHWAYQGVPSAEGGADSWHMEPARSAVAIANSGEGEDYGPHLAVEFMDAFEGEAWEGEHPPPAVQFADREEEVIPGVLPYGGDSASGGESITHGHHLEEVCEEDPPDVIYFAGRSSDFQDFYDQFREEGLCADAEVALLGGDDIAKYVTDRAQDISDEGGYPVFYTPLAASGPWNEHTNSGEHRIYDIFRGAIREYYPCSAAAAHGGEAEADDGDGLPDDAADGTPQDTTECVPEEADTGDYGAGEDDGLPSIAHAVMAHDGFRVISRALQSDTDGPAGQAPRGAASPVPEDGEDTDPSPSPAADLFPQEVYEEARAGLLREIQGTDGLSLASGEIRFGRSTAGNWYPDRMVQLVQVGELSGQHWQRAIATCGHITQTTVDAGPSCL